MSTSHHGAAPDPQQDAVMKRLLEQLEGRARREYSKGRINADDDGELAVAVAADKKHNRIIIDFGKNLSWVGLVPEEANALINILREKLGQLGAPCVIEVGK